MHVKHIYAVATIEQYSLQVPLVSTEWHRTFPHLLRTTTRLSTSVPPYVLLLILERPQRAECQLSLVDVTKTNIHCHLHKSTVFIQKTESSHSLLSFLLVNVSCVIASLNRYYIMTRMHRVMRHESLFSGTRSYESYQVYG